MRGGGKDARGGGGGGGPMRTRPSSTAYDSYDRHQEYPEHRLVILNHISFIYYGGLCIIVTLVVMEIMNLEVVMEKEVLVLPLRVAMDGVILAITIVSLIMVASPILPETIQCRVIITMAQVIH